MVPAAVSRNDSETPPVRRGIVFITVALALMTMSIDGTIVATALETLQRGLDTSINWAGWTITAYALGFVLMLPLAGTLSDRYGRRRVFLASVAVFTLASLACGLAPNIGSLIVLRAVQAAGGAGFTPSATGIIVDHFGSARDRAVGLFGSIFPIGSMIGPIFGGLFVTYASWRDVFLVNVPIGVAITVLTVKFVPRDGPLRGTARVARPGFGVVGMTSLGLALLAGMLAASLVANGHLAASSGTFIGCVAVSFLAAAVFAVHTRRSRSPFIPPRLLYGRGFGAVNLINVIFSGVTQGIVSLVPLYAATRYGIDPLRSGTLLIAEGIAAMVLSTVVAFALRRTGYRAPIWMGGVAVAAGVAALAVPAPIAPLWWLAGAAFVIGCGFGAINPASRNAGLQLAPERAATLAAVRSGGMQVGAIVTVSVATALLAAAAHPATMHAWVSVGAAIVLAAALPLVLRVPEHRGSW